MTMEHINKETGQIDLPFEEEIRKEKAKKEREDFIKAEKERAEDREQERQDDQPRYGH